MRQGGGRFGLSDAAVNHYDDKKGWERSKYVLPRLWAYLYKYKVRLILAFLLSVAGNLFALVTPTLSGRAIDAIQFGAGKVQFGKVFYYAGLMVAFYLISAIFAYALSVLMLHVSQNLVERLRQDVFDKLLELPVGYFDRNQSGDIISRISYDIDVIQTSVTNDLIQILASFITVFGALAMMFAISPILVLATFVMIPMSVGYTKYLTGKTRPLFRKRSEALGVLNGFVEEMVTGQKTIRAYAREEVIQGRFDEKNVEALDAYYNADYYGSILGPSIAFINNVSVSLVATFGALLYLYGRMTLGNISAFVLYSRKFSGPINEVANFVGELQATLAAAERIFKVMDEDEEPADVYEAVELKDVDGAVKMEGVDFGYEEGKTILRNLNLDAEPGSLTAIVGPTGAGKTTIINLLMRFYDVQEGRITVDGLPIMEATRLSLRSAYAMVLQDTWLFEGTVFDNIAYGKEGATKEEVVAAAQAANIHSYIKRLPLGYDTILKEDGLNISKGQKQLMTIARAMLLDGVKMLILDEATSNVDTRTEIQIGKAMRKLMRDKTCFVIAHRLSTIRNADRILVVDRGNVVEQGSHEELIGQKGFYYKLYSSQFS